MRKAVYAGSFDPPTLGHVDIVTRASTIFDHVTVLVAENTTKKSLFSSKDRLAFMEDMFSKLGNVTIDICSGLVVDYCKEQNIKILVRGLRTISDYEYEASMSRLNSDLNSDVDTVFLLARKDYIHLKSDVVKEIAKFRGDLSKMVPTNVAEVLKKRFHS
jgi:pantetheine-phosphate adenylyltransferase